MPLLLVALCCACFFLIYYLAPRIAVAIVIFAFSVGYQVLSYFHYFRGGWEAAGNTLPFNEQLMFTLIILSFTASCFGFVAWLLHHRLRIIGEGGVAKLKTFVVIFAVFVLMAGALVTTVPLSFEMPIDLNQCDGSASQPDFCP